MEAFIPKQYKKEQFTIRMEQQMLSEVDALAAEYHPQYCRIQRHPEPFGCHGVEKCVERGAVQPVQVERQLLV